MTYLPAFQAAPPTRSLLSMGSQEFFEHLASHQATSESNDTDYETYLSYSMNIASSPFGELVNDLRPGLHALALGADDHDAQVTVWINSFSTSHAHFDPTHNFYYMVSQVALLSRAHEFESALPPSPALNATCLLHAF